MRGSYSEIYLDEAMRNMGEMIEYGEEACGLEQDLPPLSSRIYRVGAGYVPYRTARR